MGRNRSIDFFKFLYSWIIVFYHFYPSSAAKVSGGYYGVEFYLLTAGVFLFQSFEKQSARNVLQTPYQYFKHRFARLFPWSFTAFLFAVVVKRLLIDRVHSLGTLFDYFSGDIWEILLIKWNGMNEEDLLLNVPAWTMSSMLLVGFLLWACLYHDNRRFLNLFMPLSLIIGYGVWRHLPVANTQAWIGFTTFGTFRAWLDMCLGYYCLQLTKRMSQIKFNRRGKTLLTIAECLCHCLLFWIILNRATRYYQWFATLLFTAAIAIAISGHSYVNRLLDKLNFVPFLGELSLSIYLIHHPLIDAYERICSHMGIDTYYLYPAAYAVLVIFFAVLHLYLTKYAMRLCSCLFQKLKHGLTVTDT